mmetsp:Transcript_190/g.561  ORF Transcript_190/g.561 Transcript_190/m.561 type:complete len:332 (-) Transcript_190:393-1388(-)
MQRRVERRVVEHHLGTRIHELLSQGTQAAVRSLRDKERISKLSTLNGSTAGGPQPRDGAKKRTFAGTRRTDNEQTSGCHVKVQVRDKHPLGSRSNQSQILDLKDLGFVLSHLDPGIMHVGRLHHGAKSSNVVFRFFYLQGGLLRVRKVEAIALNDFDEFSETVDPGRKLAELLKLVDDDAQVIQDVVERGERLRNHAEFHSSLEVDRCDNERRENLNQITVRRGEEIEVSLPGDQIDVIFDGKVQPGLDRIFFSLFALIEGDTLGIFSETNKRVSEISFFLKLRKVERDELLSNPCRECSSQNCVNDQNNKQRWIDAEKDDAERYEVENRH